MTIEYIDFSKLKPYNGKVTKCFEQLCYQIAYREYKDLGEFTAIDGDGGDGGVEFYLKLQNGDVWGWQCKFYQEKGRLDSNRKKSIEDSLKTACRNHKNLKKWFLCLKTDLTEDSIDKNKKITKGEQSWFKNILSQNIPADREIDIDYWGETNFLYFLSKSTHYGTRQFFFGELEFNDSWFENKVKENFTVVGEKYDPDLHSLNKFTRSVIDLNLLNHSYLEILKKLKNELQQFAINLEILNEEFNSDAIKINSSQNQSKYAKKFAIVLRKIKETEKIFDDIIECFNGNDTVKLNSIPIFEWAKELEVILTEISQLIGDDTNKSVNNIYKIAEEYLESYSNFFRNYYHEPSKQLHFIGDRGKGKTHLACDIAYSSLKNDRPAIFVTGNRFSDESNIENCFLKIMSIPQSYSFDDFIDGLDIYCSIKKTKCPIIIDGLNETTNGINVSSIWEKHLSVLVHKIASKNHLILITTCRSTYASFNPDFAVE